MQCTIRKLYSTERKTPQRSVRMERTEYAFNGSLQCGCIGQPFTEIMFNSISEESPEIDVMTGLFFCVIFRRFLFFSCHGGGGRLSRKGE